MRQLEENTMSFSNFVGEPEFVLSEKEEVYPQIHPVTMEDVTLHVPVEVEKLQKAMENKDLKDLAHELKSPGRPNEKKVGKRLADLSAEARKDMISKGVLKVDGNNIYVTGGQVRNFVMHHYHQIAHVSTGWDLATEASPEVLKLIIEQGKKSGILPQDVHVRNAEGKFHTHEIVYNKLTFPLYAFPFVNYQNAPRMYLQTLKQNFTLNALYYSVKEKKIYDFHGGLADLRRQVVRPVGSAKKKFKENPLYPLMAVRLHAMMNRGGAESIEDDIKDEISTFDIGRDTDPRLIHDEFMLGLKSALDKQKYVQILGDLGLLKQVFRGMKVNPRAKVLDAKIPVVAVAQILEPNVPNFVGVREQLVHLGYPQTEANSVAFLLKLPYYGEHTAQEFQEDRLKSGVSVKTIEAFARTNALKNEKWLKSQLLGNNFPRPLKDKHPVAGDDNTTGQFQKLANQVQGDRANPPQHFGP
jgi:tRNA nucleotidyltransferase/poly(A) polymerase